MLEVPMPSRSTRALVRFALAAVVAGACARGGAAPPPSPEGGVTPASGARSDEVRPTTGEPIEKVLQGRISGVDVTTAPDGGLRVWIRGASNLDENHQPLYILDGIAIVPGPNGSLSGLSPYDIESIRVLKDAASLTMYGSRGANGVIVIKTKRGTKP